MFHNLGAKKCLPEKRSCPIQHYLDFLPFRRNPRDAFLLLLASVSQSMLAASRHPLLKVHTIAYCTSNVLTVTQK